MKIKNPFSLLTRFELLLMSVSVITVTLSFLLSPERDYLTLIASLVGVVALIFISKGLIFGQVLVIIFAVFYGIVSFYFSYYGEMITYLLLTTPAAVAALVSWLKNPYGSSRVVEVARLDKMKILILALFTVSATVAFYFILKALGNANLTVSTLSIATSALGSALTVLRSPLYAIAYTLNDIVLITLWAMASVESVAYLPMVFCFIMFLLNDLYGYFNWMRIRRHQSKSKEDSEVQQAI
ncbi:MAG: nicotinamide mononucleotide transporter [Clostridia bacterium]|nr:nicotinamide mononucleotide transporter [Clostridia bacterium]